MGNKTAYIGTSENSNFPTVEFFETQAKIAFPSAQEEGQFSIADQTGRVVKKGLFTGEVVIPFEGISPGFYSIILFNEYNRYSYPFRLG
jgi:hypothetical protein